VSAELTRTDGSLLWSKDFDQDRTRLLPIEQKIVHSAMAALDVPLSAPARDGLARRTQADPVVHDLYMRGRFFWTQRSQDGMQRAIDLDRQAIEQDPRSTHKLSGLAEVYAVSSFYSDLSPRDGHGRARTIARQALAIDSTLAEPIASLGACTSNGIGKKPRGCCGAQSRSTAATPRRICGTATGSVQ